MYLHVYLVCRISSHHMQNRQSSSRMFIEPTIESKDIVVFDDDDVACCDEVEDVVACEDLRSVHLGGGCGS